MSRQLDFAGQTIRAGRVAEVELDMGRLVTGSPIAVPVIVVHGRLAGPTVWVNAAIHGDEINGVEVVRRIRRSLDPKTMRGTVLLVPVVNVPGFMTGDRYFPDRRDLNRSFPGSRSGSMAGRFAHAFTSEIVARADVGIDLHTGSGHRANLPQIRADLDDPTTRRLADVFDAPVMLHAANRDGSLRAAATKLGKTVLLYEAGEAWRFDEVSIATGVRGVRNVLADLGVVESEPDAETDRERIVPVRCSSSRWVRARRGGLLSLWVGLGDQVQKSQPIGQIHDTRGRRLARLSASVDGIVIGETRDPVVNQGDAVVHLAVPDTDPPDPAQSDLAQPDQTESS